jgi:hypothetical protein
MEDKRDKADPDGIYRDPGISGSTFPHLIED